MSDLTPEERGLADVFESVRAPQGADAWMSRAPRAFRGRSAWLAPLAGVAAVAVIGGGVGAYVGLRANLGGAAGVGAIPAPRTQAAMAFDDATGTMVLFGGLGNANTVLRDTWTWDGHAWTEQHPATSPPARFGGLMAYDPQSHDVVLFGGTNSLVEPVAGTACASAGSSSSAGGTSAGTNASAPVPGCSPSSHPVLPVAPLLEDTWTWDGSNWHHATGGSHPPWGGAMATDRANGDVVLVTNPIPEPLTPAQDTPAAGSGVALPCPVKGAPIPNDTVVCPGGVSPPETVQTWVWRDGGWHLASTGPLGTGTGQLITDPRTGRLAYFSGSIPVICVVPAPGKPAAPTAAAAAGLPGTCANGAVGGSTGTWTETTWSGSSWKTAATGSDAPAGFPENAVAADLGRKLIVFLQAWSGDTYVFDGFWRKANSLAQPPGSKGASFAYDTVTGQVVLFGGATQSGLSNETWTWDGTNWRLLTGTVSALPTSPPSIAPPLPSGGATGAPGQPVLPSNRACPAAPSSNLHELEPACPSPGG
jgi:hypothetical protein